MRHLIASLALLSLIGNFGCDKDVTNINLPSGPTTSNGKIQIEFRVVGNASSARIRYSNPSDGLTQVVTTLPFATSFNTDKDAIFVSLESTPISFPFTITYPFNAVQIFAGGILFREASSDNFLSTTISVSGTYRR